MREEEYCCIEAKSKANKLEAIVPLKIFSAGLGKRAGLLVRIHGDAGRTLKLKLRGGSAADGTVSRGRYMHGACGSPAKQQKAAEEQTDDTSSTKHKINITVAINN